ncbi:MAG: hypothetical protein KUG79_15070 [Pseudomonadales bacterium]|nr:hypothetical protein [Pseudomonadales bacterium]
MSVHAAGKKVLKALARHADIIMAAYESAGYVLQETAGNETAIADLVRLKIAVREEQPGIVRLNSSTRVLLDQSLKTSRLKMVNADVGMAIDDIFWLAGEYRRVKQVGHERDRLRYLSELQANVSELCDSLTTQGREIWRQIDSDFGAISLLQGKMALNKNALLQVERILKSLNLIDQDELYRLASIDRELRQLLHIQLPRAIARCREDLSDAIYRLNKMMFKLNQLAARARLVNQFRDHWNQQPGYMPEDYTDHIDIPQVFNLHTPMQLSASADIHQSASELDFTALLKGLRRAPVTQENLCDVRISTELVTLPAEQVHISAFKTAIRSVFFDCLDQNQTISGLDSFSRAPAGINAEIWLFALMAEFNAMDASSRRNFSLSFSGQYDAVFTANFAAEDVLICPV